MWAENKIILKLTVLWDVVIYCLVDMYNDFGGLAAPSLGVEEFFDPKNRGSRFL
jgi:hypothetical protein